MAEPNDTGQETLEESMERLETILDTLEGDDISLEESFALYQKGMKLVQSCKEKIDHLAVDLFSFICSCFRFFLRNEHMSFLSAKPLQRTPPLLPQAKRARRDLRRSPSAKEPMPAAAPERQTAVAK